MFLLLINMAMASGCPDVESSIDRAFEAFNDAETEAARAIIQETYSALNCQTRPLEHKTLMSLYHLDALTALAAEDQQGAVYGMIRAISADPEAVPPPSMGPEIAEMHATWSARLKDARLSLSVADDSSAVWVDGQALRAGRQHVVVEGEHLLQRESGESFTSEVVEVAPKISGTAPWNLTVQSLTKPPVVAEPVAVAKPPKKKRRKNPKRSARLGVTLSGVAVALAGGGVLGYSAYQEVKFAGNDYSLDAFSDADARESAIRGDAARINLFYTVGYALVGVGVTTTSIGIFAIPVADGGGVGIRGRW